MKRNNKILLYSGLTLLLLALVAASVVIGLVLADKMKATGDTLVRLRKLMTGKSLNIEPLAAYIIPSDDSHQVSRLCNSESRRMFNELLI